MSAEHDTLTARDSRTAKLVLVTREGVVLGCLPPIQVSTPYWQDIFPVVEAAAARFGIDLTVLRLLETQIQGSVGGEVTYLAELSTPPDASVLPLEVWAGKLNEDTLRLPYAKPGGPNADLEWALYLLQREGYRLEGKPAQVRTWNLSSLWRIPVSGQNVWLKVVPPFFAHEGAVIECLHGQPVPELLGHDGPRILMAEIPGTDLYVAELPTLTAMVELLVGIQTQWVGQEAELAKIGVPPCCGPTLRNDLQRLIEIRSDELGAADRAIQTEFVLNLPMIQEELAACGIGDTLVHGDFHPGNVRGDGKSLTLIDWGDCGVGHPLFDQSAFLERVPDQHVQSIRERWEELWRQAVPGCRPERAAELIRPIAAAQRAVKYQMFLENIEESERVYHCSDPVDWLHEAAAEFRSLFPRPKS